MASIPHFCSSYQFSPDEFSGITSVLAQESYGGAFSSTCTVSAGSIPNGEILCDENLQILFDNGGVDTFPVETDIESPVPMAAFREQIGISDVAVPTLLDYKMGMNGLARVQNFGSGFQLSDACDFGEDCCGTVPNFKPLCPASGDNWGIQSNRLPAMEHTNMKVGRYTEEERKDRILRYLKKRNQRNFNKTIKYACRKTLADRRVRVRGRFARNNEPCEEESVVKNNNNNPHQEREAYFTTDAIQIKNDDDEWLQQAVASLMYVPYISAG